MVNLYFNEVFLSRYEQVRNVIGECCVAVGMESGFLSIHVHSAPVVHPVKINRYPFSLP